MLYWQIVNQLKVWTLQGGRSPTIDDRAVLPFCDATIMEVQRLSCVAPSSVPHRANEDGFLDGYKIPKGCMMFYNIIAFHLDPDYWDEPEVFNPHRFLDGKNKDQFVPFGMGKRICMGETLARSELFIFTALILQNFKIGLPVSHGKPNQEKSLWGITRAPKPFHVSLSVRE